MNFGVIGTNWITDRFLDAAKHHPDFKLNAVYSRTMEKGRAFADKYGVEHVFTNMEEMFQSGLIDCVYIASPNKFHAEQSILAMKNGIHVLCEKPAVTSVEEMDEVIATAKKYGTTYMEAMKSTVMPTFLNVKKNLDKIGPVRRFEFHYNQYSSRYDKLKAGIVENAFKPELGNGAKMDLGVYCITPVVHLAGEPKTVYKNQYLLSTGADGLGSMIFGYDTFEAIVMYSKIHDTHLPSEIQGEKGVIQIDKISEPTEAKIIYRNGEVEDLSVEMKYPSMYYELAEFIECVKNGQIESSINTHEISRTVVKLLTQ